MSCPSSATCDSSPALNIFMREPLAMPGSIRFQLLDTPGTDRGWLDFPHQKVRLTSKNF